MNQALQLDKAGPLPLYMQIARWIQSQIDNGHWPDKHKLASEENLAKELSVNRGTIRKGIEHLVKMGKLVQVHGRGTFVSAARLDQPLAEQLVTFAEAMEAQGLAFKTAVLAKEVLPATERIARHLKVEAGSMVFNLKRVRSVDEVPVAYLENAVPLSICQGIESRNFETTRLFSAIESCAGAPITQGTRTFEARPAGESIAVQLQVSPETPVLYLEQTASFEDGTLAEYSNVWFRGDKFRLTSSLRRQI